MWIILIRLLNFTNLPSVLRFENPNPLGLVGISAVDIRDIAEATAISLTSDKHFGRTYNLNGPAILSGPKVASIWSEVLGKKVNYAGFSLTRQRPVDERFWETKGAIGISMFATVQTPP
jgi:uncharacterized protein YbjT (DUF2867 family)